MSFHVGSGCQNVGVYADAIAAARQVSGVGSEGLDSRHQPMGAHVVALLLCLLHHAQGWDCHRLT